MRLIHPSSAWGHNPLTYIGNSPSLINRELTICMVAQLFFTYSIILSSNNVTHNNSFCRSAQSTCREALEGRVWASHLSSYSWCYSSLILHKLPPFIFLVIPNAFKTWWNPLNNQAVLLAWMPWFCLLGQIFLLKRHLPWGPVLDAPMTQGNCSSLHMSTGLSPSPSHLLCHFSVCHTYTFSRYWWDESMTNFHW